MNAIAVTRAADRVPTGIHGLDERIGGGLPLRRAVLVCGESGAGKSAFGLHFLMEGVRRDESAVLISANNTRPPVAHRLTSALRASPLFAEFNGRRSDDPRQVEGDLARLVRHHRVKRLVIDDVDALIGTNLSPAAAEDFVRSLLVSLEDNLGCTTLLTLRTSEGVPPHHHQSAAGPVAERLASGVIEMRGGGADRWVQVRKMRGAPSALAPYLIGGLSAPRSLSASEPNPSDCDTVSRAV